MSPGISRGRRFLVALALLVVALGAVASTAVAASAPSATPITLPASQGSLTLPAGFVKEGSDYVYDDGKVVVTPASSTTSLGCDSPWLCLYQDANWLGSRWEFQQHYWQDLNAYGASDEVSSWSNHECRTAYLGWDSVEQGIGAEFAMSSGSSCFAHSAYVGDTWNDQASSVLP